MKKFKIGTEVAFNMNCFCGDADCDGGNQGYILHVIDGTEEDDFLERCCIFSTDVMETFR